MKHLPGPEDKIAQIAMDRPELAAELYRQLEAARASSHFWSRADAELDVGARIAWQWERGFDPYKDDDGIGYLFGW